MADPGIDDFGKLAALAVAEAQLAVVKDIRAAIRATLVAAGGVPGALGTFTMPQHRSQVEYTHKWAELPTPQPARVDRYEAQPPAASSTLHAGGYACPSASRSSTRPAFDVDAGRLANQPVVAVDPAAAALNDPPLGRRQTPLVPPWRLPLPDENRVIPRVIKWEAAKPDLTHKGRLIDLFL